MNAMGLEGQLHVYNFLIGTRHFPSNGAKQAEVLLRLLVVVPASSAEAERSFSALRRLKTWLRTEMPLNKNCRLPCA